MWIDAAGHVEASSMFGVPQEVHASTIGAREPAGVRERAGGCVTGSWRGRAVFVIAFTHAPKAIVQAFSYVLVQSKRKFYDIYQSNDLFALMDGHTAAFERFGGCSKRCKYDGQKSVVLRWEGNQPIYVLAIPSLLDPLRVSARRGARGESQTAGRALVLGDGVLLLQRQGVSPRQHV